MTILSKTAEDRIAERLASGAYASGDAVVLAALAALDWLDERKAAERAWLDRELELAVQSADRGEFVDGPAFFAELENEIVGRNPIATAAE